MRGKLLAISHSHGGLVGSTDGVQATRLHDLPSISVPETLTRRAGVVDLWCHRYDEDGRGRLANYETLLTRQEWQRCQRYIFERDRNLFLRTRAVVRMVLSRYADVAPADWKFGVGQHGKPFVLAPATAPPLYFNLSNALGFVACAVSTAHEALGVDVEASCRVTSAGDVARRFFAPSEVAMLRALPDTRQRDGFLTLWTLKESYIKARGLGLSVPLNAFAFLIDETCIQIEFDKRILEDPAVWQFASIAAESSYRLAVGVDTGGVPLRLRAATAAL